MTLFTLALLVSLSASSETFSHKKKVAELEVDSIAICIEAGDSCMQQFNTFESLKYYQKAYDISKLAAGTQASENLEITPEQLEHLDKMPEDKANEIIDRLRNSSFSGAHAAYNITMKLADCHYKRANFRQASELLKNIPEDSLSHESFRQLAYSYQKQGDTDSYIYWAGQLIAHYPMDGEMVAGLTVALARKEQAWKGIDYGDSYFRSDSTNILVNRALGDAYFMDRQFDKAAIMYERLLLQGDSTFNTLYSAGMCYSQLDSLELAYQHLRNALFLSQMQHANCAYRLGVVCVDTKRYEEGLGYLDLATQLMQPDTTVMKAITLSSGEAYYLTFHHDKAVEAWKEHLKYNPTSIATYYNIASATYYYLPDGKQAKAYFEKFLELARKEEKPTAQLTEMIKKSEELLRTTNFNDGKPKAKLKPIK